MIRILHAADLHLDSPFAALAPGQSAQRREEQRQMVRRLTEECARLDCQLLLLAGDLFDSERVYRETAELLCEALGSVCARVFIAPGNHDPWSPASPYATLQWPENIHIFRSRAVEAVRLEDLNVTVYGAAFTEPHDSGLLDGFQVQSAEAVNLMVVHGTLDGTSLSYNPISAQLIAASGLDYLALGHIHRREVRILGKTAAVNPGCAMGRGFDETGVKGACYVEIDDRGCRVTPVDLGARIYETLTVPVSDNPIADLEAALPPHTERDLYAVTLTGTCPPPDLEAIHNALAPRFYALELIDATMPPPTLWADLDEDSLKGGFLRRLKADYDTAEDVRTRKLLAQAAQIGVSLMEGREVPEL